MGFWSNIFNRKSTTPEQLERMILGAFGGNKANSGIFVTPDRAMQCAAVFACTRVLSESVSQLPLHFYFRNTDGSKTRADRHHLSRLLNVQPNEWQTAFEFREMLMGHVCLRGNAYAYKVRVDDEVRELIPLHPDNVTVKQNQDYSLTYTITDGKDSVRTVGQQDIFHLRGLSSNGYMGVSPVALHREAIGLALATEEHGARLFSNGARLGGMLKHPGRIGEDAAKRLKSSFEDAYAGLANSHKTLLLEEGMDWIKVGMTAEDSQFLESRKYQRSEIASIFRVPPHLIGDLERATFSNIEHQSIEFVTHTLLPWLRRWEGAISRDLIPAEFQSRLYAEHLVDGLLRGDIKSRYDAYAVGRTNGWLSTNDIRRMENMDPVVNGDEYLRPLNLAPLGTPTPDANGGEDDAE